MSNVEDQTRSLGEIAKRHGWLVFGIPVAAIIVSGVLFEPLRKIPTPDTIGWVGALGLQLTAWGLIVSVVGFAFTLWQLNRTQSASAAAAKALIRIKRDFSSFDLVTEVRTARAYAEATQAHISDGRWVEALSNYNNLRASLNKLTAVKNGLDEEQLETARDYLALALDACQSIDSQKISNPNQIPSDVLNGQLRELDGFLITLEYTLKDAIRGSE